MTTPVARSYARSPSSTLIVLSNDERREPCSRRQFQPPSLLAREPRDDRRHVDAEVGAVGHRATVDALLDLALPERLAGMLPARVGADPRDHPPRSLARSLAGSKPTSRRRSSICAVVAVACPSPSHSPPPPVRWC